MTVNWWCEWPMASAPAQLLSTSSTMLRSRESWPGPRSWRIWPRRIRSSCPPSPSRPTSPARPMWKKPQPSRLNTGRRWRRTAFNRRANKLVAAGYFEDSQKFSALANSNGNFGYQKSTQADFTCTVRTDDAQGSGWVARNLADITSFSAPTDIQIAMDKAKRSSNAKALEPGKYTVILEPAAAADLLTYMIGGFDARQADENRSFMSKKGGGNKIGEKLFDERVNFYSDPQDPSVPVLPWDDDGVQRTHTPLVTKGVVDYLQYSRYWAKLKGKPQVGEPGNLIMTGGDKSTMDLVKGTQRGVLVTRTWYIRMVDPQTVLLTGLTRDGTFYIENGEIKYPIKNFRFNESPVIMLNNVEEFGKPVRVQPQEAPILMMLPPMKLREFTFTSLSDAV